MVLQVLRTALSSGTKCGSEVIKQLRHTDACAQPLLSADSMGEGVDSWKRSVIRKSSSVNGVSANYFAAVAVINIPPLYDICI